MQHPEFDLARLEEMVSLRCGAYEQSLRAHLRGQASDAELREAAAAYRSALRDYRDALLLQRR